MSVFRFAGAVAAVLITSSLHAQPDSTRWSWFPDRLLFIPLVGSHEEPRMGIAQEVGTSRMNVSIGNSVEVLEYSRGSDTVRASVVFLASALANDYRGYRLKIDAADGIFGIGFVYQNASPLGVRFRILHLSAHLVDGHYNDELQMWRDGKVPFPFSRNYGELIAAYTTPMRSMLLRLYGGVSYAPIVKPVQIRAWTGIAGWELRTPGTPHWYLAHHFFIMGTPLTIGTNTLEGGMKFGTWQGRGFRLFISYRNGWDSFGEYYNVRRESFTIGFAFDFWP